MQQVVFRIPIHFWSSEGIPIYGFGLMLFVAFVLCLWLGTRWGKAIGIPPEVIQDLALYLFLGGIIGARITYIIFHLQPSSLGEFLSMLPRIWDGGIILYGSIMGGLIAFGLYYYFSLRHKDIPGWKLVDLVAPLLALGLVFGRLGCFMNGCCYGQVACEGCPEMHFPMSAAVRQSMVHHGYQTQAGFLVNTNMASVPIVEEVLANSPAESSGLISGDRILKVNNFEVNHVGELLDALVGRWPRGEKEVTLVIQREGKEITLPAFRPYTIGVHPTQLYEVISMALIFFLLLAFKPLKIREGQLMALMMICYAMHRYLNEKLRVDDRPEGFEKYVSVLVLIAGICWFAWLTRPRKPAEITNSV